MQDTTTILMQTQFQLMIAGLIKTVFIYLFLPVFALVTGGLTMQYFIGRKSFKAFITGLSSEIDKKVDFKKFDESIARTHEERETGDSELHVRINEHIEADNKVREKMGNDLSYIKGRIQTFLESKEQS